VSEVEKRNRDNLLHDRSNSLIFSSLSCWESFNKLTVSSIANLGLLSGHGGRLMISLSVSLMLPSVGLTWLLPLL
jgi:hypothetical protein